MNTSVSRPAVAASIFWRFLLAMLFGALVGALGGLTASALSLGVLLATLLARPLFQFASIHGWWKTLPPSKRGRKDPVSSTLNAIVLVTQFVLLLLALFWELPGLAASLWGPGSLAFLPGLVASILFGFNERSLKAFIATIGFGVAAGLGAFLGFLAISSPDLLTPQLASVVVLLAAGGGLLGALAWLLIRWFAKSYKADMPAPEKQPAPAFIIDEEALPHERQVSRRAILVGAVKGAGLLTVGAGMTWATRAAIPQFIPIYIYRGHAGIVQSVVWSPDGSRIASAGRDNTVQVWRPFQSIAPALVYRGHADTVFSLAWSPNGRWIASTSFDKTTHIWDAHTGGLRLIYTQRNIIPQSSQALAWSPDSTSLAIVTPYGIEVLNATTGQPHLNYTGHDDGGVNTVAWSPDGKYLVSGGGDLTIQVWDSTTGTTQVTMPIGQIVYAVAWSPDGKRVISGNDGTFFSTSGYSIADGPSAQVFDVGTGRQVLQFTDQDFVDAAAWSPDGKQIATGGRDRHLVLPSLHVWDAASGTLNARYSGHQDKDVSVHALAWSPNGRWIASATADQTVHIWQPE